MCKTPLELVQTYLCGSMKMIAMGEAWFFTTFTNNNTKTWCTNLLLKQKSKAWWSSRSSKPWLITIQEKKLSLCDNGNEFTFKAFKGHYKAKGI